MTEDYKENTEWRSKPISPKQMEYLHVLMCDMFKTLNRGQASDLIRSLSQSNGQSLDNFRNARFSGDELEKGR